MHCHPKIRWRSFIPRSRRSKRLGLRAARPGIWVFRPRWDVMEDRTLLATMNWTNPAGGDWDNISNWVNAANPSDHHVPTSSDDADLGIGGVTVTVTSYVSNSVNSVTIASGTTLSLASGILTVTGGLTRRRRCCSPGQRRRLDLRPAQLRRHPDPRRYRHGPLLARASTTRLIDRSSSSSGTR